MSGDEDKKEFGVTEYVHAFEKSLNYMTAVILAILTAAICYIGQGYEWKKEFEIFVQGFYQEPKKIFYIVVAVLVTLPYYFYYTLKDDVNWNAHSNRKDELGLKKIFVLYEICIMSIAYLLIQGELRFTGSKVIICFINIGFLILYLYLMREGKKQGGHIGYFIIIIAALFVLFVYLVCINIFKESVSDWMINILILLDPVAFLILLFGVNAAINLRFLAKCEIGDEKGIISKRINIMIPVISICIYTIAIVYCFFVFKDSWIYTFMIALWITVYEIVLSRIFTKNNGKKAIYCVIVSAVFIFGMPAVIQINKSIPDGFLINWLLLIAISIYMAAIKFWGYIFKFHFLQQKEKKSKEEIMDMLNSFHNSLLGGVLVLILFLSFSKRYIFLVVIAICALASEGWIYYCILRDYESIDRKKAFNGGKIIELLAIVLPIIAFALDYVFESYRWKLWQCQDDFLKKWYIPFVLFTILLTGYILSNWPKENKRKEEDITENFKDLPKLVIKNLTHMCGMFKQALPSKTRDSLLIACVLWLLYTLLTPIVVFTIFRDTKSETNVLLAMGIAISILILDWIFLFKELLDYYLEKMKMEYKIREYKEVFDKEWEICLGSIKDFKEKDASQFKIGQRLRPILFFMGSSYRNLNELKADDYVSIAKAACSLELIHKSSVMFDDFIDGDNMRNGQATFNAQYDNTQILILLGCTLLGKAQTNFVDCKEYFKCSDDTFGENIKKLAELIIELCDGCYKELNLPQYDKQNKNDIRDIISLETVSLIKRSMELGYSCFHENQSGQEHVDIEKLGESFGFVFQLLNDLEPFSQRELHIKHKGRGKHLDYGKKNMAFLTLYSQASDGEKANLREPNYPYEEIIKLYKRYQVEQIILKDVKKEIEQINRLLKNLQAGNEEWVNVFKALFNYALQIKGWEEKIKLL